MIIKTQRNALARFIDFVLTLLAWCVLIYLVSTSLLVYMPSTDGSAPALRMIEWDATSTLIHYFIIVLIDAAILIAWARYNKIRFSNKNHRQALKRVANSDLCRHFHVEKEQLQALQQSNICTLELDNHGRLQHISN